MLKLTEKTAGEIDILLGELLKEKPITYQPYIDLNSLIKNNPIYHNSKIDYLKALLYLTMVVQNKEGIPDLIRGAKYPILLDGGEPIRDFLDAGGFTTIWKMKEEEQRRETNRYYWTNTLVILGILIPLFWSSVNWKNIFSPSGSQTRTQSTKIFRIIVIQLKM